ncbi:MAG: hypothetical protein RLZZ297_1728, partial [Chloroflexota bacterium]
MTMQKTARRASPSYWYAVAGTALVGAVSLWLLGLSVQRGVTSVWVWVVLCDLVVGLPLLWYFTVFRPRRYGVVTVLPMLVVVSGLTWFLVPAAIRPFLKPIWLVIPLV